MVKLFTLHKLAGLLTGALLFLLALTGLFLDHDTWRFLYTTTLKHYPPSLAAKEARLFEGYSIDPADPARRIACGKRGIFESRDGGHSFRRILPLQCNALRPWQGRLYAATDEGIYVGSRRGWHLLALPDRTINALAVADGKILAAEAKRHLYLLDAASGALVKEGEVHLDPDTLGQPITLNRFVRDLHYGRGLLDGDASLLINDYGALVLIWLALSGYLLWWLIHRKRAGSSARRLIKSHANLLTLAAALPLVILAVTGIFLDHARALGSVMRAVSIPSWALPPVYRTLRQDIWSLDYDGKSFRIGNRYGVFRSFDMREWQRENPGFAYRMIRRGPRLYVSGMGAPNRLLDAKGWHLLPRTPHMFRDVIEKGKKVAFFSTHHPNVALPKFSEITLYTLLLALHDGSFFADGWIWVNDIAALGLLLLLTTGTLRWLARKRHRKRG